MLRTGWSEADLGSLSRSRRDGVRWVLYAEILTDRATADLDRVALDLEDAEFELRVPPPSAASARTRSKNRISTHRAHLKQARALKKQVRDLLWPADEPDAGDLSARKDPDQEMTTDG